MADLDYMIQLEYTMRGGGNDPCTSTVNEL